MEARKIKTQDGIAEVQGPSGYIMLVHYTTDNMRLFQMELNHKLKKCRYEYFMSIILVICRAYISKKFNSI